ncbi:MAG: hypothetical protein GY772_06405 [bacterium]|nr:hypothetical protein [bacterium]
MTPEDFGVFAYVADFMKIPRDRDQYLHLVPCLALQRWVSMEEFWRRVETAHTSIEWAAGSTPSLEGFGKQLETMRRQHDFLQHRRVLVVQAWQQEQAAKGPEGVLAAGPYVMAEVPEDFVERFMRDHYNAFSHSSPQRQFLDVDERKQYNKKIVKQRLRSRFDAMLSEEYGGRKNIRYFLRFGRFHSDRRLPPQLEERAGPEELHRPPPQRPRIMKLEAKYHKRHRYYGKLVRDVLAGQTAEEQRSGRAAAAVRAAQEGRPIPTRVSRSTRYLLTHTARAYRRTRSRGPAGVSAAGPSEGGAR